MLKYCLLDFPTIDGIRAVLLAAAVFAFESAVRHFPPVMLHIQRETANKEADVRAK